MPDPTNPNLYGQPYVKGPDPINIGSINSAPLSTGFPGSRSGKALSQDDMINLQNRQVDPNEIKADKTYLSDVASDLTGRYDTVIYGANNEDAWGAQQSWLDKGVNGVLKGTNLAATTVVGGFATVGGAISSIFTGRLADIWDNPVMQEIDKWNEKVDQEYLPNYYTDQEKNAEWYSPDNWWTANFLFDKVIKNSGFAVGAIISGNIASKALSATGTVIGEAAAARAAALEASQTFKAYAPLMRNTARAFSSGKNAEAAALLEGEISSIADVAAKTSRMGEIALETNQFAKINDVGRRIGIAAYSQAGEAAFEGVQTSNQFRQQLIDQYKMNNFGVAPSAEELKIIDQQTEKVGKTSFLANMALLSVTEYIQLPKLLGSSYAAEKQAANSLLGRADNVVLKDGKYVAEEVAKTKFGKLYNTVKGVGKYAFDPKEMGQEIGQYAIQVGTQNYYNKAYQGKEANVLVDGVLYGMFGRDGSGEGVGALVSKEGIEGGIIGGLTGAAMQAKGNYMMSKATKSNTADFLELLNGAPTYKEAFQYKLDAANRGVVLQEQQQAAIEAGDKLEAKDLNADMMHNYLAPRIKYGRMDMVMDDIQDMRKQSMSPDGMASLKQLGLANMNDTAESFSNKLAYFEQTAKYTEELFKSTNLRYSGEILKDDEGNPILNSKGQPQRKYSDQVIDKMIYAASKVADYDVRIPEVSMLPVSKGVDVQSVLNAELTDPQSEVIAEALIGIELSSNINKADIKQNVIDVLEMSLRRKEYLKEYNDLITNPQKYNEERQEFQTPEDTKTSKETISIKTKKGVRDIEIGTEYFLGKVVDFDDKGYEVYRAPRMVVLGRNEDGTIKVQDSDGVIHDLKESTLERYNLGKVDSTLKNKKAKFYMENWNNVYEFNFGKKYGKQKGRIEYDPENNQMLFKYKNKKGEIKEIEVTGDQFVANKKKGFTEPMIKAVGQLTAAQQKAQDEYTAEEDPRIQAKREARLGILNDLFDTLADKQIKIERTIDAKQKEVVKAKEEYEKLTKEIEAAELDKRSKKVDKFKAVTARAIDNAMRLSRMQEQLEREIEALKLDAEEIDATLNYITDMASNIDEYSTNFKDFMDELQDEIIDLEILQETTQAQISTLSKLARETQRALDATIDYLSNLIANFESRYPNVPRLMGQDWVDFLKANPNFLKVKPNYRSDLQLIDDIIAETEDLEITPNEQRLKDLIEHMDIMQGALDDVQKEIEAKEMILNKFKQVADKYKQQEAEKKKLESDQALQAEYLGTNSKDVQSFFSNEFYEASSKKDDLEVVGSTIAVTRGREGEQIREHHARANRFGFNMHKFANKGSIRGMIVTAATEAEAGIDGLMNYLTDEGRAIDSQGKPINPNKIIALVMVQDNDDNTYTLVDENGVPLTKEQLADPTKHAIFQVFPADELEATYTSEDGKRERGSMFRKMTTDGKLTPAQESLKQQYNKWRAARLAEETVPTPQSISASFGIPDYVTYKDDKGKDVRDYDARVAVEETGLLEEGALLEDPVLMVATKNEAVTYGSVTFNTPLGRVFLKVPGGLLKLKNRNLTENEVNTIYDVLLQVTKNVDKDGTTKTAETQYLFNWLKTVVYWGIPRNTQTKEKKNPGYNSVWFENVTEGNVTYPKLFLSGLGGEGFDFTVNGLQNSENEIKAILRGMYNNVNSTKVNTESFKKKYTEIIGIDEAGQPIKRDWDNYQTYLLSAEGRTNEEIPLVTQVRPLTDPSVPNKKGIYFTLDSTIDSYEIPVPPPVVTQAPTPAAPTKTAATVSKDALEKIKTAINTEENIAPLMDNIFKTINEAAYEAWQETLDQAQLQSDLTPILEPLKGDEDKVMSAVSKYLLNRYIDEQLVALDKTAQQTPAPAATVQPGAQKEYNLEGEENIYTCKFGKIPFKINAQEYIDSKGEKGFSITFEAETMAALMTEKGLDPSNNKDLDKARAIFYGAILAKIRPQLDAFQTKSKIPASDAPQTTFVLDGIAENTVQIGSHGKITFTLDGKKFNESGQGFNIQFGSFDGEVLNSVADAKGVSPAEAQQLIGNDIYMKVLQQLEALKIPVAPAIATPFVPNVSEAVEEVSTTPSTAQEGIDWKTATLENLKARLISGELKSITSDIDEPGDTVKFSYYQAEDRQSQRTVGGFEDFAEVDIVEEPKGNYFTAENGFGEGGVFNENDPKLDKIINDIIDYNKAASTSKEVAPVLAEPKSDKPSKFASRQRGQKPDDAAMRVVVARQAKKFQGEDWKKLEKWIGEKFPNIPVYRVKNIIQATNGKQAWGMLHNGAIYIYENAEVGTVYHEVFEAVWKMFADAKEKEAILKEFTSREGTFVDRETGRTVEYKYATAHQIKEELAEEFRDAVLNDKLGKSIASKSLIGKLFSQLIDFIKSFFYGKDAQRNTKELFNKIGDGYYNTFNPYVSQLAYANVGVIDIENASADDFSDLRVTGIPAVQLHEIIDEMTFITLTDLIKRKESLFNIVKPRQKELYEMLNVRILDVIGHQADLIEQDKRDGRLTEEEGDKLYNDIGTLYDTVDAQWESIIERHKEKLKTFNIQFDENDELDINEFEKSKEDPFGDARKIDSFRKANGAVKLLLGTLPLSYVSVNEKGERELKVEKSSIGGAILIPADSVFIRLKNKLFDSVNIDDMLDRLREMAKGDPNFENLYTRLTKSSITAPIDVRSLDESSWQLITAFWKSMKSQNADAISVFIMPGGDVVVSDSTLTSAAKQAKRDMTNTMVDKIKSNSTFFSYEPKTGRYYATDKIKSMPLSGSDLTTYTALLNELGIEFNIKALSRLTDNQALAFRGAVEGIKRVFSDLNDKGKAKTDAEIENDEANGEVARGIVSLTPRALNIEGNLFQLGLVQAVIENKEFESTYFNMNGERTQTYIGVNALSGLHNILSKLDNITELSSNPAYKQYEYLRNDVFAKGSVMMQKMFNLHPTKGTGKRIAGTQDLMKSVYIDGMDNQVRGVKKESSKLSAKERLVQEINLNLNGYYLNLVPGDAAIEWAVKMHNDLAFVTKEEYADKDHYEIFKNYFISEVELARDGRNIVENENRKPTDLRFFKSILGEELNNKITKGAYRKYTAEELYNGKPSEGFKGFRSEINEAVDEFIKKDAADTEALLKNYGIVYYGSEGLTIDDIKLDNELELNEKTLRDQLQVLSINYMIANIEMHKLLYSDPYQYSDELKRIKNFNSPRQALLVGSQDVNAALNEIYNKGFKPGDAGYTDMTLDYFRTITLGDILSVSDLKDYDPYKETDGGGYIMLKANRVFGIRSGEWTEANEAQYRHDMAYEDLVRSGASKREIEKFDRNSPEVASTYTPRKPIVSGNKANGRDYNDVVLHKFALLPLSFRLLHKMNPDSNAIKLYDKMQKENIDYAVFESGSKVGAEKISPLYDKKGKFDETPFEDSNAGINIYEKQAVSNIPFTIMGVQAEVPSKDATYVTQGSQVTKLATLDFMEAGVPIDFDVNNGDFNARFIKWIKLSPEQKLKESELYKDIKHNQDMLNAKIEYGYKSLLKKLGITKTADGFIISNINKLTDTLRDEILKREVNDNISDALKGFKSGDVVLEATPAYQQIRNILYSIADKNVVSPKISGGMKVQIPSTLLESERPGQQVVKGKNVYSSNLLKFYTRNENGKTINVCQLMVGKWFKSDMSDEELINYFNNDPEGKKEFEAIMGVAFRIPTQKQNSIDVFEIAKFLPEGYKDSVVIPSELVMKAGSDFDIDKLSIYLKNIYPSNDKKPKVVPYLGTGEEAIAKFGKMYDAGEFNEYLNSKKLLSKGEAEDRLMEAIFPEQYSTQREDVINDLYRQSLENEYIQSLQKLISNDLNFDNLIKPNSADDLKELTDKINDKLGRTKIDYGAVGNMLSRAFMTNLRHAFVTGKYAIGIAAVNQTNHSQNQRSLIYVDPVKIKTTVDPVDAGWLGDGQINFNEYNSVMVNGVKRATLSKIKSADDKTYISDTIGQFIDGYVDISKGPWIMEMGATPNVASTWLFLVKLGVPINTVGYFMNQPIIRDYLRTIQNNGYSWLFIEKFVDDVKYDYLTEDNVVVNGIPNETDLYDMMGKSPEKMSPSELAQQNYILDEFLKYAMMASHMFQVTQGSNFDTATINDPYLVFKKQMQLAKAQRTMFSSINEKNEVVPAVDSILKNSFVGELANVIYGVRDAFAEILISDKKNVRKVMEQVLAPYTEMSDRDFIKISQKAVNDLFDWAVQNDRKLNNSVKKILLGNSTEKSAAKQIIEFRDKVLKDETHPLHNNMILKSLQLESGKKIVLDEYKLKDGNVYQRENISLELLMKLGYAPKESRKMMNMFIASPDNISIKGKDAKVYDQNMIIYGFNELKEKLGDENKDLYGKLVRLAVIQSGLTNSPIAFTNLLPYDDFKEFYNQTLSNLENIPNLADFKTLDTMERNNWNNTNVVVFKKGRLQESKATPGNWYYPERQFLSKKLEKKMLNGELPEMVVIPIRSREGRSDFMTYSYEGQITKAQRIKARRIGDTSHVNKGLFKKVYKINDEGKRVPLIQESTFKGKNGVERTYLNYVYKMINAWGDSYRAQEFYGKEFPLDPNSTVSRPSVLDNGFMKVMREVEDSEIELALLGTTPVVATIQPTKNVEVVDRYSVADVQANPDKIYVFGDNTQRVGMGGQAQIRNNPNAMGIATKITPSMDEAAFMSDKDLIKNRQIIDGDIAKIKATGKTVVMPKDGLGTGLAQLKEKAPQTYAYLKQRLLQEFGFDNDNGSINNDPQAPAPVAEPVVEAPRSTKERVLKDGKSYNLSDIGIDMLIKLGYSNEEIGKILKEVRKEIC